LTFGSRRRSSLQQAESGGETLLIRANPVHPRKADDGIRLSSDFALDRLICRSAWDSRSAEPATFGLGSHWTGAL
jgi:hypothetical protein